MNVALATQIHISEVMAFFDENLDRNNSAVYSEEFLCPLGIQASIRRKQMIIATVEGHVVGALRFYRRKTQNKISLYQFAIHKVYRGTGLLKKMLETINDLSIVALCPTNSSFNEYYHKSSWKIQDENEKFITWVYNA